MADRLLGLSVDKLRPRLWAGPHHRVPTVNTREKTQCFSQAQKKPLEIRQSILFSLTGSALRRDYLTEPNQLGKE